MPDSRRGADRGAGALKTVEIFAKTRGRGTCKGCGADVIWAQLVVTKKVMPLNPPAAALGTLTDAEGRLVDVVALDSHFATCPKAAAFRRPRGGRA